MTVSDAMVAVAVAAIIAVAPAIPARAFDVPFAVTGSGGGGGCGGQNAAGGNGTAGYCRLRYFA